jgi:His-Xaa-Ser system protein HxsD
MVEHSLKGEAEHRYELLRVSQDVYSLDSIKRASYRHGDKGAFDIQLENGVILVDFLPRKGLEKEALEFFKQKFLTDVLDEDLREKIRHETTDVRNLILAHAFSKSALIT